MNVSFLNMKSQILNLKNLTSVSLHINRLSDFNSSETCIPIGQCRSLSGFTNGRELTISCSRHGFGFPKDR